VAFESERRKEKSLSIKTRDRTDHHFRDQKKTNKAGPKYKRKIISLPAKLHELAAWQRKRQLVENGKQRLSKNPLPRDGTPGG